MGTAIAWLIAKGIPEKFARPLLIGALFLAILGVLGTVKCAYDKGVIAKHDAKQEAATAKADKKADNHAADQRRVDDARLTQETGQLKEAQTNAKSDHDRSLARFRCIRLQQAARAAKRQPPSCSGLGVPSGTAGSH